jgi:hypothetical protein
MYKNLAIALLSAAIVLLSVALVRLETFHYASVVGMCGRFKADDPLQSVQRHNCLHATETRTNPVWHIFYALRGE